MVQVLQLHDCRANGSAATAAQDDTAHSSHSLSPIFSQLKISPKILLIPLTVYHQYYPQLKILPKILLIPLTVYHQFFSQLKILPQNFAHSSHILSPIVSPTKDFTQNLMIPLTFYH